MAIERLGELQEEILSLIIGEANKVNDFYLEREKESVDRFNAIYNQVHHLLKLRKEEEREKDKDSVAIHIVAEDSNGSAIINGTPSSGADDDEDEDYDHHGDLLPKKNDSDTIEMNTIRVVDDAATNALSNTQSRSGFFDALSIRQDVLIIPLEKLEAKAKKWLSSGKKKSNENALKDLVHEYYKYVILVKNYKVLNYTALVKILKKAEKNTTLVLVDRAISQIDEMVFKTSKVHDKLSNSIEKIFADVFCGGRLRDARKQLRNTQENSSNPTSTTSTFVSGMCLGWTSAILILIYYILYTGEYDDFVRFSTVYNLYSTLGLIILWSLMFGIDVLIWTRAHVHYSFIFEMSKNKLTHHKVFQAVTMLSVLWITSIGVYMWVSIGEFPFPFVPAEYTPLLLFGVYFLILICPFNIFQLSLRKWFLVTIFRVITAPAKSVKFSHFFMGDQLSSLVLMMVQMTQFICFYTVDVYHPESQAVCPHRARYINPWISALPATWRFLQCLRRYHDSKDFVHLRNALKYFLSIVVVFFSAIDAFFSNGWTSPWRIIWLLFGIANSSYSYWWDLMMDWSVVVPSKTSPYNPFKWTLRKKRMYNPKGLYYIAIITNLWFRATWTFTKSLPQLTTLLPSYKLVVVIAIMEILRRGTWNIFRLENEHVNNCGKFRATRDIPLPYDIDAKDR
eukprot:gene17541-20931_t